MRVKSDIVSGRPVKVGVIGCGSAGSRRLGALADRKEVRVAFAADVDSDALAGVKPRLEPGCANGTDVGQLLGSVDVDALIISTPPTSHEAYALAAMERGIRHLLVEKPLAESAAAAARLAAAATRCGAHVKVGSNLRYFGEVQALARIVSSGELGHIERLDFHIGHDGSNLPHWASDPEVSGGGTLLDNGVHVIDLALSLGALPEQFTVSGELDWLAAGIDRCASWSIIGEETRCRFRSSWTRDDGVYLTAVLEGARATARLNIGGGSHGLVVENGEVRAVQPDPSPGSWQADTYAFIDALLSGGSSRASAQEGAAVVDIVDQVYRAARTRKPTYGRLWKEA